MQVQDVMSRSPGRCQATDALAAAVRIMWEGDCGCVPVVDGDGGLCGIVTDRDACMAAFLRGQRLAEIPVGAVMSRALASCKPGDDVDTAAALMRQFQVRRLPVVDGDNRLVGVLSQNDLVRAAAGGGPDRQAQVVQLLAAIGTPRQAAAAASQLPQPAAAIAQPAPSEPPVAVIPAAPPPVDASRSKGKPGKPKSRNR